MKLEEKQREEDGEEVRLMVAHGGDGCKGNREGGEAW